MMATTAAIGHGTEYWIKTAAGAAGTWPTGYTQIGEVFAVSRGVRITDEVEASHYGSPDAIREYVDGWRDFEEGSVEFNWIAGSATDLFLRGLDATHPRPIHSHVVVFPNDHRVEYPAKVMQYIEALPSDDRMTATMTFKPTGLPVWDDTP